MVSVGERSLSHMKIVRYRPFKNTVIIESVQNFAQSTKFEIRLNFDKVVTLIPNSVHRNPGATPIYNRYGDAPAIKN